MAETDVKFKLIPQTDEVTRAVASLQSNLETIGQTLGKTFGDLNVELSKSLRSLERMRDLTRDIARNVDRASGTRLGGGGGGGGGGLGGLGGIGALLGAAVPGLISALAIGGGVTVGAAIGSRFTRRQDASAAFGGAFDPGDRSLLQRIHTVLDSLDNAFGSKARRGVGTGRDIAEEARQGALRLYRERDAETALRALRSMAIDPRAKRLAVGAKPGDVPESISAALEFQANLIAVRRAQTMPHGLLPEEMVRARRPAQGPGQLFQEMYGPGAFGRRLLGRGLNWLVDEPPSTRGRRGAAGFVEPWLLEDMSAAMATGEVRRPRPRRPRLPGTLGAVAETLGPLGSMELPSFGAESQAGPRRLPVAIDPRDPFAAQTREYRQLGEELQGARLTMARGGRRRGAAGIEEVPGDRVVIQAERIEARTFSAKEIAGYAGAAMAVAGGAGVGGMVRGAIGGMMFSGLGERMAQRAGLGSQLSKVLGGLGAGIVGPQMGGDIIQQAQALLPMYLEFAAGRSRATIGGFGGFFGRAGAAERRLLGVGNVSAAQLLPEAAAAAPGGFGIPGAGGETGRRLAAGLAGPGGLSIGLANLGQMLSPLLMMRTGGGGMFGGFGSEGALGAAAGRQQLLERINADATAIGMERAMPEFTNAVTEGVRAGTQGLFYSSQQIARIQDQTSASIRELVRLGGYTAEQAARVAAVPARFAGGMAEAFLGGGYTREMEMAMTAQTMRQLGISSNDEMIEALIAMQSGDRMALPLLTGFLQQGFGPGRSPVAGRATASMLGRRGGMTEVQAYQRIYQPMREAQERGGITEADVENIFQTLATVTAPTESTAQNTARILEVLQTEGRAIQNLSLAQDRQLGLAARLAQIGMATLNVETATLTAIVAGGQREINAMARDIQGAANYLNALAAGRDVGAPQGDIARVLQSLASSFSAPIGPGAVAGGGSLAPAGSGTERTSLP